MKQVYPDDGPGFTPGRKPGWVRYLVLAGLVGVGIALARLFPAALRFMEMGAREVRYLWWLILMVALGVWLIWGFGKTKR